MLTTLPHLSEQPWALFDALERLFAARGPASAGDHYRAMFELLCNRLERRTWVERSGGTLRIIARLIDTFPEARFVHLVRDGRNTALSMSRHIGFRMALICFQLLELLGVDPFEELDRSEIDDLSDELVALLPEHFSAEAFWAYDLSPTLCGHYWSGEIRDGLASLATLAPERLLTLRYEQLLAAPTDTLTQLSQFLDLGPPDRAWIERAAAMVGHGRSDWKQLPAATRDELAHACAPGFEALRAWGIAYLDQES
jgi:putative sulfotransferase